MKKLFLFLLPLFLLSCSNNDFKVKGVAEGASDEKITLEKADFSGRWIIIDSTRTSASGDFSFKAPAPDAPEIYRIASDNRYIYFPIDSTEQISIKTKFFNFDTDFSLDGSENAKTLEKFEKRLIRFSSEKKEDSDHFKRSVYSEFIQPNSTSIVSYYVLTKIVDGRPLFNPENNEDTRYYAAVATAYKQYLPDDPRTRLLEKVSLDMLRRKNAQKGHTQVIEAEEIKFFDVSLPDPEGRDKAISSLTGKGKPVIVAFTLMNQTGSPAINADLNAIYVKGMADIYQISLDADRYAWREAARNLPWTCVFDNNGNSGIAAKYNVSSLPTFFIINSKGELADRASSVEELTKKLSSLN